MPAQSELPAFGILNILAEEGFQLAPRVAMLLCRNLAADRDAILATAASLSPAQRIGQSAIPDPLPLLPATERAIRADLDQLTEPERAMLLRAAVCVNRRTSVLLAASSASMTEAAASKVAQHLTFIAGRFEFQDPRIRAAVHHQASLADRNQAHANLAVAFRRAGETQLAHWHKTLSTVEGDSELTLGLLDICCAAVADGELDWAFAVAREAAYQAPAELAKEAQLIGAETALHAGYLIDASDWIGKASTTASADSRFNQRIATAQRQVDELTRGKLPTVFAGKSMLGTPITDQQSNPLDDEYARVAEAFQYAEVDEFESALQLLNCAAHPIPSSPLVLALRRLSRSLILFWSGNLTAAAAEFNTAVLQGPAEIMLGGLAGVLSQRLDIMVHGRVGSLAASLKSFSSTQHDPAAALGNRAVLAYLQRQTAESATLLAVSAEHRSSSAYSSIYLPSLAENLQAEADRPASTAPAPARAPASIGRSARQIEHARLRLAIVASTLPELNVLAAAAVELGQQPGSPFERGRTEFALARAFQDHRDYESARRYLLAATNSFEEAGAWVWQEAAEAELAISTVEPEAISTAPAANSAPAHAANEHNQGAFAALTEREAEVAILVAEGNSNREVALRLHLSVRTVEVHLSRVFAKLGVRSRVELSILAHRGETRLGRNVG